MLFYLAEVIFNGEADVEHLAEICNVSIVSILTAITGETALGLADDELVPVAELVGHVGAGHGGQDGEHEGRDGRKHFGWGCGGGGVSDLNK